MQHRGRKRGKKEGREEKRKKKREKFESFNPHIRLPKYFYKVNLMINFYAYLDPDML